METSYIPAKQTRTELKVVNSRFIATVAPACSVEEARSFISLIKKEFIDASHNVPAFVIGHGSSTTNHCNDNSEPSGTAGKPVLAVLTGSGFGDIVIVVTRYFGGTKLGRGGLVRAYGAAARQVLLITPRAKKTLTHVVMISFPYAWYEHINRLISDYGGQIIDKDFSTDVTITAHIETIRYPTFQDALREVSRGQLDALIIETKEIITPVGK